jgi:antitoxin VapB
MILTKPFMNGRSQALRIPKEYRFKDEEDLCIRKVGDVLMIIPKNKILDIFENAIDKYPEDAIPERNDVQQQIREVVF